MYKYSKVIDEEKGLCDVAEGTNEEFYKHLGMKIEDVEKSETDGNWYLKEKCPHYTEEELKIEERKRIDGLKMTPRDFLLSVIELGAAWEQIKQLISSDSRVEIELNYCQYVYRGNPLLNQMCSEFNITPEQLDEIFLEKGK